MRMTTPRARRPTIALRCKECAKKTDHVMVDNERAGKTEIEEIYECQECGELKRIYEISNLHVHVLELPPAKELKTPEKKRRLF